MTTTPRLQEWLAHPQRQCSELLTSALRLPVCQHGTLEHTVSNQSSLWVSFSHSSWLDSVDCSSLECCFLSLNTVSLEPERLKVEVRLPLETVVNHLRLPHLQEVGLEMVAIDLVTHSVHLAKFIEWQMRFRFMCCTIFWRDLDWLIIVNTPWFLSCKFYCVQIAEFLFKLLHCVLRNTLNSALTCHRNDI